MTDTLTSADIDVLANALAEKLTTKLLPFFDAQLQNILHAHLSHEYCEGAKQIGDELGVSDDTIRNYIKTGSRRLPICGHKERHFKGRIILVPICRRSDLKKMRENLNPAEPIRPLRARAPGDN